MRRLPAAAAVWFAFSSPLQGEAIRGTVPHEYTLDGMVDQLVEVYQSLAASSSA